MSHQLLSKYKNSRDRLSPEKRASHAQLPKFLEILKQEVVNDDSPIWDEKFKPASSQFMHHRKREREAAAAAVAAAAGTAATATSGTASTAAAAAAVAGPSTSTGSGTSRKYGDQPSTSKKYKRNESQSDSKYQLQQQLLQQQQQQAAAAAAATAAAAIASAAAATAAAAAQQQQQATGSVSSVDDDLTDDMVLLAIKQINETNYVNNLDVVLAVDTPRDETVKAQELRGEIELHIVGNSLTRPVSKQSMLWLLGLHSVFAYQLPVMPREYISHLVFDP